MWCAAPPPREGRDMLSPAPMSFFSPSSFKPSPRLWRPRMAKKRPFPATGLLVITELVLINLAFLLAYWMRYSLGLIGEVAEPNYVEYSAYLPLQVLLNGVLLLANAAGGLYRRPPSSSWVEELMGLLGATSMGMMAVLALGYLFHGLAYSRAMFLFAWALIFGLLA